MSIETSPIRYLGWRAVFQTGTYTVVGSGDTQSEALIMLRSAWAEHCRRNLNADPGYLDEFIDDVNYEQVVIPSGVLDGKVITTTPLPKPTVEEIVALALDPSKGSPVRMLGDDENDTGYGNAWTHRERGEEWVHAADVFSYDEVCALLTDIGVSAYAEQTGGGCGTIYAGPLVPFEHAEYDHGKPTGGVEIEMRYKVALGPGVYGWGKGPSVGNLAESWVGPNDDGESGEGNNLADLAITSTRQIAALIALYVIDSADLDYVEAIGLDATQRGIPQNGA